MAKKRLQVQNYARLTVFIILLVLSIIMLLVSLYLYRKSDNSLENSFVDVNISDNSQYVFLEENYITLVDRKLSFFDYENELHIYAKEINSSDNKLAASETLIAFFDDKTLQVMTIAGEYLYSKQVAGQIFDVKCGNNIIAVFSQIINDEEVGENIVYFYNTSGAIFDSISFAPQYVVDFDFLDSGDIWFLTTDPDNSVPVSRVITYTPGVSMTGLTNMYSEIAYKVFFTDEYMFIASTENLSKFDRFSNKISSNTIYDWDVKAQSIHTDTPCFVVVPRVQNRDTYYTNAKILYENYYYKINFPVKVNDMLMNNHSLYLFGDNYLYIYNAKGVYQKQYSFDNKIEFIELAKTNTALIKHGSSYKLLTLP